MFTVYILRSKLKEWYYIGHTSDIDRRLEEHNNKRCKSTSPYAQFDMVYFENFDNKSEAFLREMQIKKYRHGEAFKALLKNNPGSSNGRTTDSESVYLRSSRSPGATLSVAIVRQAHSHRHQSAPGFARRQILSSICQEALSRRD